MIEIIKSHTRIYGVKFCTIEFITVFVIAFSVSVNFLMHHLLLNGFIYAGIAINCLPIVIIGIHTLLHSNISIDNETIWNKNARKRIIIENPHINRDTMIIVVTLLLPFVCCLTTFYEYIKNKNK